MFFGPNPHYVYIVRCSDGSLYTGMTQNIDRRVRQHNGLAWGGAKYTRSKRPVELVYVEKYETRKEASSREFEIKALSHAEKEELASGATKSDILKAI